MVERGGSGSPLNGDGMARLNRNRRLELRERPRMAKRKLFDEVMDGLKAMKAHGEGKVLLRSNKGAPLLPEEVTLPRELALHDLAASTADCVSSKRALSARKKIAQRFSAG